MRWVALAIVLTCPMAGCLGSSDVADSSDYVRKDFELEIFNDGDHEFYVEAFTRDDDDEVSRIGNWYVPPGRSEGNTGWLSNLSNWTVVVLFYMPGPLGSRALPDADPSSEESFHLNLDTDCQGVDPLVLEVRATLENHGSEKKDEYSGAWLCKR